MPPRHPRSTLFPYTTLFRSELTRRSLDAIASYGERISAPIVAAALRSEEHTSELQSRGHLVCRLLLEKKNYHNFAHKFSMHTPKHICCVGPYSCLLLGGIDS